MCELTFLYLLNGMHFYNLISTLSLRARRKGKRIAESKWRTRFSSGGKIILPGTELRRHGAAEGGEGEKLNIDFPVSILRHDYH